MRSHLPDQRVHSGESPAFAIRVLHNFFSLLPVFPANDTGARVGRYIIASTTAKYSEPANILSIPCDLAFACSHRNEIDDTGATLLADTGCSAVIEGASAPCTKAAKAVFRKRGLSFAPHLATLCGSGIVSGLALATNPLVAKESINDRVEEKMKAIFTDVKATATEFNARGDYGAGNPIETAAVWEKCRNAENGCLVGSLLEWPSNSQF